MVYLFLFVHLENHTLDQMMFHRYTVSLLEIHQIKKKEKNKKNRIWYFSRGYKLSLEPDSKWKSHYSWLNIFTWLEVSGPSAPHSAKLVLKGKRIFKRNQIFLFTIPNCQNNNVNKYNNSCKWLWQPYICMILAAILTSIHENSHRIGINAFSTQWKIPTDTNRWRIVFFGLEIDFFSPTSLFELSITDTNQKI